MYEVIRSVFYCDHCDKHFLTKSGCSNHENKCKKNPNNMHACFDFCARLKMDKDEGRTTFYCEKKEECLYSYKAEKRGMDLSGLERMPLECDHHLYMFHFCERCYNSTCDGCEKYAEHIKNEKISREEAKQRKDEDMPF